MGLAGEAAQHIDGPFPALGLAEQLTREADQSIGGNQHLVIFQRPTEAGGFVAGQILGHQFDGHRLIINLRIALDRLNREFDSQPRDQFAAAGRTRPQYESPAFEHHSENCALRAEMRSSASSPRAPK